jgi:hypothetical protein
MRHAWDNNLVNIKKGIESPNFGKTGSLCPRSIKVINTETGEVFDSIKLASESTSIRKEDLAAKLRGAVSNDTNFKYYTNENIT